MKKSQRKIMKRFYRYLQTGSVKSSSYTKPEEEDK